MEIPKKAFRFSRRLLRISKKLNRYQAIGDTRYMYLKYKRRQVKVDNEINMLLLPVLESENQKFHEISHQNYSILESSDFKFKITENGLSMAGSYTEFMEGSIHSNGYLYCETKEVNFPFPFSSYFYPAEMKGLIDCLGNVRLETTRTLPALIKRLPVVFSSKIGPNGNIKLIASEREPDFITSGDMYVSKIIGYPFKSKEDEEEFLENRLKLLELLDEFRTKKGIAIRQDLQAST
jgi:hypothetical protein